MLAISIGHLPLSIEVLAEPQLLALEPGDLDAQAADGELQGECARFRVGLVDQNERGSQRRLFVEAASTQDLPDRNRLTLARRKRDYVVGGVCRHGPAPLREREGMAVDAQAPDRIDRNAAVAILLHVEDAQKVVLLWVVGIGAALQVLPDAEAAHHLPQRAIAALDKFDAEDRAVGYEVAKVRPVEAGCGRLVGSHDLALLQQIVVRPLGVCQHPWGLSFNIGYIAQHYNILAEKNCAPYVHYMGRKKEFEKRARLTVLLDSEELSSLSDIAKNEGKSQSRLVRELIQRIIKRWRRVNDEERRSD